MLSVIKVNIELTKNEKKLKKRGNGILTKRSFGFPEGKEDGGFAAGVEVVLHHVHHHSLWVEMLFNP